MHAHQCPGRHPHILSAPCTGIFTTTPSNLPLNVPATAVKKGRGHGPRPRGHFTIGRQLTISSVASYFPLRKRETSLVRGTGGEVMQGFERRSWGPPSPMKRNQTAPSVRLAGTPGPDISHWGCRRGAGSPEPRIRRAHGAQGGPTPTLPPASMLSPRLAWSVQQLGPAQAPRPGPRGSSRQRAQEVSPGCGHPHLWNLSCTLGHPAWAAVPRPARCWDPGQTGKAGTRSGEGGEQAAGKQPGSVNDVNSRSAPGGQASVSLG